MNIKKLRKHFGAREVPALLEDLAAFDRAHDGYFSSGFELFDSDGKDAAQELWGHYSKHGVDTFGPVVRDKLAFFGLDGDGSRYALWFNKGQAPAAAPVVYLNSEGSDDTNVIAGNLEEFVSLLLLDRRDLGMFFDVPHDDDHKPAEYSAAFAKWARGKGITVAEKPKKRVSAARKANPGFGAWIDKMRAALDALAPQPTKPTKPVPPKEDYSMRWLKVGKAQSKVEAAMAKMVAAVGESLPGLKIECKTRFGLTETRPSDFATSGAFPADDGTGFEWRMTFNRGSKQLVCLIAEPPFKRASRATWEATLWLYDQPERDPVLAHLEKTFQSAFAKVR